MATVKDWAREAAEKISEYTDGRIPAQIAWEIITDACPFEVGVAYERVGERGDILPQARKVCSGCGVTYTDLSVTRCGLCSSPL